MERRGAVRAHVATALVITALLAPAAREPPRDSYPLSTYPMFAKERGRVSSVATVVGISDDGTVERLTPRLIGGSDEVVLAVETVSKAVRLGPERSLVLCQRVAERVARERPSIVSLEVRVEVHDAVDYFTDGRHEPSATQVHATCPVGS